MQINKQYSLVKQQVPYGSGNSAKVVADILANTNIENTQKLNSY